MQHHDVRDNAIDIHPRRIDRLQALREPAPIDAIVGGAIDQRFKRHEATRGQEASLAHVTAKHAAKSPGARNDFPTPSQHRAYRRTQTFGHTKRSRIGVNGDSRDGSIEDPSAVKMRWYVHFGREVGHWPCARTSQASTWLPCRFADQLPNPANPHALLLAAQRLCPVDALLCVSLSR
jgi:hypothetical protein